METGLFHVTAEDIPEIKNKFDDKVFLIEVDGIQIVSLNDYFSSMSKLCHFPRKSSLWATYNDWMMDFSWIDKDRNIVIIIYGFTLFMHRDISSKAKIIKGFQEDYIPWWDDDVKKHVVGGKPRKFAVYLVD